MNHTDPNNPKRVTSEHFALSQRIFAFSLDQAGSELPFSRRLARENGWPPDYAQRIIEEYKRFAFLATIAGHPVTPSDPVDQVWHLHLALTFDLQPILLGGLLPECSWQDSSSRAYTGRLGRTAEVL